MSKSSAAMAVLFILIGLIVSACGISRSPGPVIANIEAQEASVQRGRRVYDTHCYRCHLHGSGGIAPALNNKRLPRFLIEFQVRHGLGAMPAFSEEQIPDRQLEDLSSYVAALRKHSQ